MQRKTGRFVLYSVALTTAVTHVDDLHQECCNRSTAYMLQYYVLYFQLYCSTDVEIAASARVFFEHPSYIFQKILGLYSFVIQLPNGL